jgi:arginine/lysine/ornithine decarboxylase
MEGRSEDGETTGNADRRRRDAGSGPPAAGLRHQSTHKTLTSLRQGSMIHVFDQDFSHLNEEAFREAYMTHTSTSPNYQILASLDIGGDGST